MNTMIRNSSQNNFMKNFGIFAENIKKSGKNPQSMIDELISSGKITKEQYEQAKKLASFILGKK